MKTYFTAPPQSSTKTASKIVILYFFISILWVFFSDTLISSLNLSLAAQTTVSIIKGWSLVIVTSILLYCLIKNSTGHITDDYNMFSKIMETVPVGIAFVSKEGQITFANTNAEKILGLKKDLITSRTYNSAEWKITSFDGSPLTAEQLPFSIVQRTGNAVNNIEHAIKYNSGRRTLLSINAAPIKDKKNNFDGMISVIEDITERKRNELMMNSEANVLELLSTHSTLHEVLENIVLSIEQLSDDTIASILLLDEDELHVYYGAAPHLPDAYNKAIEGAEIGPSAGSCGTAAYRKAPVIVTDIETDPLWNTYRELARANGLRACWSTPIIGESRKVLGTFAMYYREPRSPNENDFALIKHATHIACIAIEQKRAEQTLRENNAYNRMLFNDSLIGLALTSMDGKLVDVNSAFAKIIGRTIDETLNLTYWDITPEKYAAQEQEQLECLRTIGCYGPYEKEYIHEDGHLVPVRLQGLIIERGGNKFIWSSVEDITEHKLAEENKKKYLNQIENILESVSDAFVSLDTNWRYIYMNKKAGEIFNRNPNEMIGKHIWTEFPEGIGQVFYHTYYKAVETQEFQFLEEYYPPYDKWFENRIYPSNDGLSIFFHDITVRKKAEEEIIITNEELRTVNRIISTSASILNLSELLENIMVEALEIVGLEGGTICLIDDDDTLKLVTSKETSAETIKDLTENKIKIGDCLCGNCAHDHCPLILPNREEVIKYSTREVTRGEDIRFHAAFPFVVQNKCVGVLCVFTRTDKKPTGRSLKLLETICNQTAITIEMAHLYESIKESEERLRLSTELANVAVWEYDFIANSMSRSNNHDQLYGLEWQANWKFDTFLNATHPDDREYSNNIIQKSAATGGSDNYKFDFRVVHSDHSIHWLEVTGQVVERNTEGQGIIVRGTLIDITERKRTEKELFISNEKFTNAFQVGPAALTITRIADGKFIDVNESFLRIFGFNREEVIGHTSLELNMLSSEERKKLIQKQIETGGLQNYELQFQTKLGKTIIMLFSSKPLVIEGEACHITTLIDITDRKIAEEKVIKSREELRLLSAHLQNVREDERMNLAREMHDEVGQILTSIKMNLSLMRRQVKDKEKKFQTKELEKEITSMSEMVDHAVVRLRKMITELRPELLDKLGLIPALEWYVEEYEKETKIKSEFKCDFEELLLDHNLELTIFRIIQEALTNVVRHSSAKRVSIKVIKMKDYILVEIIDDGKGITEEELKRKESFGLLGMRERANIVGGKIEIEGVPGKGTTVRFALAN